MATRLAAGCEPEAEPVIVDIDAGQVSLCLDDGERISFDAAELEAALAIEGLADREAA